MDVATQATVRPSRIIDDHDAVAHGHYALFLLFLNLCNVLILHLFVPFVGISLRCRLSFEQIAGLNVKQYAIDTKRVRDLQSESNLFTYETDAANVSVTNEARIPEALLNLYHPWFSLSSNGSRMLSTHSSFT